MLEVWLAYVEEHSYAWRMSSAKRRRGRRPGLPARGSGPGASGAGAELGSLSAEAIPRRELEPLAELMRMGMASLVLWWIDNPRVPRGAVLDAMSRAWAGLLR